MQRMMFKIDPINFVSSCFVTDLKGAGQEARNSSQRTQRKTFVSEIERLIPDSGFL